MTDFVPFNLSDGSHGWVDKRSGRPVLTVTALGGGVVAIDVVDEALAWVMQNLPRPSEMIERPAGSRLVYRGKYWS